MTITPAILADRGFIKREDSRHGQPYWEHPGCPYYLTEGKAECGDAGVWFLWDKPDFFGPVGDLCTVDQIPTHENNATKEGE